MDVAVKCTCPPKANGEPRHAEDTVSLRESVSFRDATTIRRAVQIVKLEDPGAGSAEVLAAMSEQYLLAGIEGWSRVDEKGKPLDVTRTAIRSFLEEIDPDDAINLVNIADELYAPVVLLPLLVRAQASSPPTPTDTSTSARTDSGSADPTVSPSGSTSSRPPRPSRRSSTSTIPTAGTATITELHGSGSSSLPKAASAR